MSDAPSSGFVAVVPAQAAGSIGVLRKCGFTLPGDESESGVIRFELERAAYAMRV